MRGHIENPLSTMPAREFIGRAVGEIPTLISRYPNTLRQKREITTKHASGWLNAAHVALSQVENDIFVPEQTVRLYDGFVGVGFTNTCFRFKTGKGEWVLKIGAQKAHTSGYPDPSTREYADWYYHNLTIQRDLTRHELPHLIPEPQEVIFAESQGKTSTLVIQPYYKDLLPTSSIYHLRRLT